MHSVKRIVSKSVGVLLVGVVIPAAFFILLEVALRVFGYGFPAGFFMRQQIGDVAYDVNNYKFSWRFFPRAMARLSTSLRVPVNKGDDVLRIFVLGESAAMGDPEPAFSFSRMLEVMFEKQHPGKKVEIYNTAVTAINSHVLLPIMRNCLEHEADIVIVYTGNNEVIGPYGMSASLTPFLENRGIIKAQVALGEFRTGQLFKTLVQQNDNPTRGWGGMEMFTAQQVRHNDPGLNTIYLNFEDNLREICSLAAAHDVQVILSTVVTNERDCAPFFSMHHPALDSASERTWEYLFAKGIAFEEAANTGAALEHFQGALAIDSTYAELNFRIARCYLAMNDGERARRFFLQARQLDALRFRADTAINAAIRKIGNEGLPGVYLADAETYLKRHSAFGLAGNDVLYEHVHLNLKGNYLLAQCVLEQTEKILSWKATQAVTLGECQRRLAFTPFDEARIAEMNVSRLMAAPFTSQYTHHHDVALLQQTIRALAAAGDSVQHQQWKQTYADALRERPDDWFVRINYLKFLHTHDVPEEAARQAEALHALLPYEAMSHINMGITRSALGRYAEAEDYFNNAIQSNPYIGEPYRAMARLCEDTHQYHRVPGYMDKGRATREEFAAFYNRAGIYFARTRALDSAIAYFKMSVRARPMVAGAEENMARALEMQSRGTTPVTPEFSRVYNEANHLFEKRQWNDALRGYERSIQLNPSFPKAHNNLGVVCLQLNRPDDALRHFSEAIRTDPDFLEGYRNLAMLQAQQRRYREARDVLKKGLRRQPDAGLYHLLAEVYIKLGDTASARKCAEFERVVRSGRK